MEDESFVTVSEALACELGGSFEAFVEQGKGLFEVLSYHRSASGASWMVAWVGETSGTFEKHFQFEEGFLSVCGLGCDEGVSG
jgi:hypothetical protein